MAREMYLLLKDSQLKRKERLEKQKGERKGPCRDGPDCKYLPKCRYYHTAAQVSTWARVRREKLREDEMEIQELEGEGNFEGPVEEVKLSPRPSPMKSRQEVQSNLGSMMVAIKKQVQELEDQMKISGI